ncbi:MAG: hypothetical protein HYZ28_08840 [Myxococcales bacterium]|nr:hypothetical protein [Myxococcales bacterium]
MVRRAAISLALLSLSACGRKEPSYDGPCTLELADRGEVRVFVVGHRLSLADAESYEAFEASFRRHLSVIKPCLSRSRPNLLLFPEDSGLVAWFLGQRALLARGASDSESAFNGLYAQNFRAADAYRLRFPGISAARSLTLAGGDVAWRAMERTFGRIARELDAHVITSANLPYAERTADPALAAVFRDPDAEGDTYVATSPEVRNAALLYGPDGRLQGRIDKVYLTDPEEQLLDMNNNPLEELGAFELPYGKVGAAISRDAFYPPFLQRMEDLGVELVVQPEAWSGWTIEQLPGDWLPDVILSSGWVHTQKYRGFRYSAAPMLTGNLLDFMFDGQTWISHKLEPGQPARGFVGSLPLAGWLKMGPWAFEDPAVADPSLSLGDRRARLRQLGKRMRAGSGAPEEGRYADTVIAADLELYGDSRQPPLKPVSGAAGAGSVEVAPSARGNQTGPDAAYDAAGTLYAVWSDSRSGLPRVFSATSADDGATWTSAREVEAGRPGPQLRPSVAAGRTGEVLVAWQQRLGERERIVVAVSTDGAASFRAAPLEEGGVTAWPPSGAGTSQWEPDAAMAPGGAAAIAFTDFRSGLAPRVRLACAGSLSAGLGASGPVDESTAGLPRVQPSQVQPTVTFTAGGLAVAWIDYRERDWQVYASVGNGCGQLGPAERVTEDSDFEVLAADPQLAAGASGELLLAWDEIRNRRGHTDVRLAIRGTNWQTGPRLQSGADEGAFSSRFRPSAASVSGRYRLVFQDTAYSKNGLGAAVIKPTVVSLEEQGRFDDTGSSPNQLTRPRIAARQDHSRAVVLFEDDRAGWSRVRASTIP